MVKLLVVDDEPAVLQVFCRVFEKADVEVLTAQSAADAVQLARDSQPDAAVVDVVLPDMSGLELFRQLQRIDSKLPTVFITASGDSETAIEAMKLGGLDYLIKPLDYAQVRKVIEQAFKIRRLMIDPVEVSQVAGRTPIHGDLLVGRCPAMQQVYKAIGRVASQNVTVLIRGGSGTGKELVARALYQHSHRSAGAFMEVNSAAIPEALLESELFGHERGAFTGADRRRIGKFEQCNGGTLFLDEIGDMSPPLQAKMLRVLQEQRFERVGGNESIQTDVRVIAATNRDLEQMVSRNQFRDDLYYRLNGYTIRLPPLRDRGDDLILLVDHFLALANRDLKKQVRGVSPEALDILSRYSWPGNIRQLQSVIRHSVLQTTGPVLLAEFLPDTVRSGDTPNVPAGASTGHDYWDHFYQEQLRSHPGRLYDQALARMESEIITRVLRDTDGNQVEAARILGITRTTLRTKIRSIGIVIDRVIQTEADEGEREGE